MMNLSRRMFLGGLVAVTATAVMPGAPLPSYPVLHADGINDDYPAIAAMGRGDPVVIDDEVVVLKPGEFARIERASLLISQPVCLDTHHPYVLKDCRISTTADFPEDKAMFYMPWDVHPETLNSVSALPMTRG